jgi:O-antigen ligase
MRSEKLKSALSSVSFVSFLALTASLAIQKPSVYTFLGKEISLTDAVFPVVAVLTVISFMVRSVALNRQTFYFFAIAYVAAFVISTVASDDFTLGAVKTASTVYLVLIAVAGTIIIDSERRLSLTILTFLIASLVPVCIGIFTVLLFYLSPGSWLLPYLTYHYGAVPVGNYPRLSSTFVSASMFCNFLNVALMFTLLAWRKNWLKRQILLPVIVAIGTCAIFTISAGLGALFLALGFWFWFENKGKTFGQLLLIIGLGICCLSLISSFIALQPYASAPYSFNVWGMEFYPSSRLLVWSEAWTTFRDNFIFGNGPGNRSAAVLFQNTEGGYSLLTDAHNSFLSIAAQTGIIGLTLFVALTIYIVRSSFKNSINEPLRFALAVAFLSAFLIQGLTGAFEDARHLWFLIGLIVASSKLKIEESTTEFGRST